MLQKDDRSRTIHRNPVMIRCFLIISQVYYLIVFNSFKTARLEQITFWKLVLNLMNVFENSFYSDRYPVHFQFTVPLWLILPVKNFPYRFNISISISLSSVFPPFPHSYTQFFAWCKLFPKVFCFMDTQEYSWEDKAFKFHSLFFESA